MFHQKTQNNKEKPPKSTTFYQKTGLVQSWVTVVVVYLSNGN